MRCKKQKTKGSGLIVEILSRIVLALMLLALAGSITAGCKKVAKVEARPPDVEVAEVTQRDVQVQKEWVGSTDGSVNAVIRAQVQGYLIKQNYTEGQFVKTGQLMFEIDPRTFQATLDQAKADLAQKKARWETTKANLARVKPLAEQNAVSKKDLDDAVGQEQSAHSAVDAAQAAVDKAQLDLGFTRITSPINGIAGIAKAQIGNLVGPGQVEELTTVSTVNPIKVLVPISEQEYLHLRAKRPAEGQTQQIDMVLADGSVYPHKGAFAFADRQVDPTTGTLKVALLFPNPGNVLRPGQFGKVRVVMETKKDALLVPQRAVSDVQGRNLVAVVGQDNKVDIRQVQVANQIGSNMIISQGLKPGDKIIVEGIQKVKQGQMVTPKPYEAEKPTAAPEGSGKTEAKPATAPAEKR